jgi:hypothetical protein
MAPEAEMAEANKRIAENDVDLAGPRLAPLLDDPALFISMPVPVRPKQQSQNRPRPSLL